MGIFDFWKRDKRLRLSEQILRLKQDFKDEIKDFEHFKELQVKKRHILRKIKEIWNKKWQEAEELVKTSIPDLIRKQLAFIERDIRYVDDEDYILNYLIAVEKRRNSILAHYISQNISQQDLSAIRNSINPKFIGELKETLRGNSIILREKLIQLKGNIQKQLEFFNQSNPWSAINQDEKIVMLLNEEDTLTQRIEHVINHLMNNLRDIVEYELRESGLSRREFLQVGGASLAFAGALPLVTLPKGDKSNPIHVESQKLLMDKLTELEKELYSLIDKAKLILYSGARISFEERIEILAIAKKMVVIDNIGTTIAEKEKAQQLLVSRRQSTLTYQEREWLYMVFQKRMRESILIPQENIEDFYFSEYKLSQDIKEWKEKLMGLELEVKDYRSTSNSVNEKYLVNYLYQHKQFIIKIEEFVKALEEQLTSSNQSFSLKSRITQENLLQRALRMFSSYIEPVVELNQRDIAEIWPGDKVVGILNIANSVIEHYKSDWTFVKANQSGIKAILKKCLEIQKEIAGNWERMYLLPVSEAQQVTHMISQYESCFYAVGNAGLFSTFKSLGTTKNPKVRKFILDYFIENSVVQSFFRRLTLKSMGYETDEGKSPGDSQYMGFEGLVEVVKNLKPEIIKEFDKKNFHVYSSPEERKLLPNPWSIRDWMKINMQSSDQMNKVGPYWKGGGGADNRGFKYNLLYGLKQVISQ